MFFGKSQIGPKRLMMNNGYMVCLDVPISRTGTMMYHTREVGIRGNDRGLVVVDRDAGEVFNEDTLASFNGLIITDEHPPIPVTASNSRSYAKGHIQNVRRGTGSQQDLTLADFVITDQSLIDDINSGKREVSAGYDCDYEETGPGRGRQVGIIGNHVALVKKGRCGPRCAIGDSAMAVRKKIVPVTKRTIVGAARAAFTANDQEAFDAALLALDDDEPMEDEALPGTSPSNVHINFGEVGMPALDALTKTITDGLASVNDRLASQDAMIAGMMTQFQIQPGGTIGKKIIDSAALDAATIALADAQAAFDAANAANPPAAATRDAALTMDQLPPDASMQSNLTADLAKAVSLAEILAPGLRMPTFDAALSVQQSRDAICGFKRSALTAAMAKDDVSKIIKPITGDADVLALSCDQANMMFVASAELVRAARRVGTTKDGSIAINPHLMTFHVPKPPMTPAEINRKNAEFAKTRQVGG
jgi:hypothetical protein